MAGDALAYFYHCHPLKKASSHRQKKNLSRGNWNLIFHDHQWAILDPLEGAKLFSPRTNHIHCSLSWPQSRSLWNLFWEQTLEGTLQWSHHFKLGYLSPGELKNLNNFSGNVVLVPKIACSVRLEEWCGMCLWNVIFKLRSKFFVSLWNCWGAQPGCLSWHEGRFCLSTDPRNLSRQI